MFWSGFLSWWMEVQFPGDHPGGDLSRVGVKKKVSRSDESLWWLVNINLTLRGLTFASCGLKLLTQIVLFHLVWWKPPKFWAKTGFKLINYLYEQTENSPRDWRQVTDEHPFDFSVTFVVRLRRLLSLWLLSLNEPGIVINVKVVDLWVLHVNAANQSAWCFLTIRQNWIIVNVSVIMKTYSIPLIM